jgi:hypothetical protein
MYGSDLLDHRPLFLLIVVVMEQDGHAILDPNEVNTEQGGDAPVAGAEAIILDLRTHLVTKTHTE